MAMSGALYSIIMIGLRLLLYNTVSARSDLEAYFRLTSFAMSEAGYDLHSII